MKILAYSSTHDSSVCVLKDGRVEYFCKEERLSRKKRDKGSHLALTKYRALNKEKIDHILYCTPTSTNVTAEQYFVNYIKKCFNSVQENFSFLNHHKCHASLAFYNSGFDKCLVFVIDRNGSIFTINNIPACRESESVFLCSGKNSIAPVYKAFWLEKSFEQSSTQVTEKLKRHYTGVDIKAASPYSIVKVYEAATTLIGQSILENGKTMGLSSYGKEENYNKLFVNGFPVSNYFISLNNQLERGAVCFASDTHLITKDITEDNFQLYANRAKQVQLDTQEQVLQLIKKYSDLYNTNNVCIVGGYGLNVVANNYYIKNLPGINFYFEPIADDTGISIGAAMLKHALITGKKPAPIENNFFHYYNVKEKLEEGTGKHSSMEEVIKLLLQGKCVAIFDGAPEAGPRALGHRSILLDPRIKNGKELVNKIKKREWYRPFAGTILKEQLGKYFNTNGVTESPFMTINFESKEGVKDFVPSIIHVDGTSRIQTVKEGFFYNLISLFYEKTGCPMLLNTSFNLAGEPLVQTKKEALDTFNNSLLDAVYFVDEQKLVVKN